MEYDYGRSLFDYCQTNKIGVANKNEGRYEIYFNDDEILSLSKKRCVYYAHGGGLVIGRLHTEGGINILRPNNNGYELVSEMEGFEFLSKPIENDEHGYFYEKINEDKKHLTGLPNYHELDFPISPERLIDCPIIDMTHAEIPIILITNTKRHVINRASTQHNIEKLIKDTLQDYNESFLIE